MHTFQVNSHINENGVLSVKLPKEWAEKDVNVVLVLELLSQLKESVSKEELELTDAEIEQACGILTAPHSVTLAQMDEAIKDLAKM
jgi:hypothetical protein